VIEMRERVESGESDRRERKKTDGKIKEKKKSLWNKVK
jgi:hypothetical protein